MEPESSLLVEGCITLHQNLPEHIFAIIQWVPERPLLPHVVLSIVQ
jgi:hypothetical protein